MKIKIMPGDEDEDDNYLIIDTAVKAGSPLGRYNLLMLDLALEAMEAAREDGTGVVGDGVVLPMRKSC